MLGVGGTALTDLRRELHGRDQLAVTVFRGVTINAMPAFIFLSSVFVCQLEPIGPSCLFRTYAAFACATELFIGFCSLIRTPDPGPRAIRLSSLLCLSRFCPYDWP